LSSAVVFDLDGTLADTLATIAGVANRGLETLGLPTHPVDDYRRFVGDGIVELCRRVAGPGHQDRVDELLAVVRELYARHRPRAWVPEAVIGALRGRAYAVARECWGNGAASADP